MYLLRDGFALRAYGFAPVDFTLRPIAQQRFGDTLLSVFQQGDIQLSLQSPQGFFTSTLPPAFATCALSKRGDLFFLEGKNHLAAYTGGGKCVFMEEVLDFSITETELNATLPLSDTLGRVADCTWKIEKTGCTRTRFSLRQAHTFDGGNDTDKIREELLPYAFFESVLLGENYTEILSADLQLKAQGIPAFLGDFCAVTLTANPYTCGLIRQKAPRLFEVDYFTVKLENGKIVDITV